MQISLSESTHRIILPMTVVLVGLVLFVPFKASAQSANEDITVNLTVATTSTSTDDQDDEQEDEGSRPGQTAELLIDVSRVEVGQETVEIVWETTVQSQSSVRWQRADGSGQSFVQANDDYGRTHTTRITGLDSGTRYEIELTAEAQNSDTQTRREIVQTELPDGPQSVTDLRSNLTGDGGVQLTWNNPDGQYDYVRVTRRSDFFSNEPLAGELVYEGLDQRIVDSDIRAGETYFYSVFTRSEDGQWSAPALTAIYVPQQGETPETDPIDDIVSDQPEAPEETRILLSDLTFADLIFSQGRLLADSENKEVNLTAEKLFSVGLDYEKLPEVLKTVVVTITHPESDDKSFSFLLRADSQQNFYKATVGGLETPGEYEVEVTVLDYKYRRVKTLTGQIRVTAPEDTAATSTPTIGQFGDIGPSDSKAGSFLLLLLLILLVGGLMIGLERWLVDQRSQRQHG